MVVHRLLMGFPLRKQVPTQNVRPGERAERRYGGAGTAAVKRRTASIALFHGAVEAQTADGPTVRDTAIREGKRHQPDADARGYYQMCTEHVRGFYFLLRSRYHDFSDSTIASQTVVSKFLQHICPERTDSRSSQTCTSIY